MGGVGRALVRHRDAWIALSLASLVLLAGSTRMAVGVCGSYHDDAIYVSTAKALADGDGYRLTGVPGTPRQTKYSILYPAILSIVWTFFPSFPENLLVMQSISLLAGAATVALAYLYLVRRGYFSRPVAFAAGLCCAVSSGYLYFSTLTMAEPLFTLAIVVGLWGIDRQICRPSSSKTSQLGIGALAALPFLLRSIGAPLMPVTLWLLYRSGHRLRWYLAGMSAVAFPWICWSLMGRGVWDESPVDGYYTDYFGCWSTTGLHLLGRVIALNSLAVLQGSTDLCLGRLASLVTGHFSDGIGAALMSVPGLLVWLAIVRDLRTQRLLPWIITAYLAMVLVWPWPLYRFLVPILPFMAVYLFSNISDAMRRVLPSHGVRKVAVVGLFLIMAANLSLLVEYRGNLTRDGYPRFDLAGRAVQWSSYQSTIEWIQENSDEETVIASGLDSMLSLYANRQAYRPFIYRPDKLFYSERREPLITTEQLIGILRAYDTTFLVQCPLPGFSEEREFRDVVHALHAEYPDWLRTVYQGTDTRFVIYELDPECAPSEAQTLP